MRDMFTRKKTQGNHYNFVQDLKLGYREFYFFKVCWCFVVQTRIIAERFRPLFVHLRQLTDSHGAGLNFIFLYSEHKNLLCLRLYLCMPSSHSSIQNTSISISIYFVISHLWFLRGELHLRSCHPYAYACVTPVHTYFSYAHVYAYAYVKVWTSPLWHTAIIRTLESYVHDKFLWQGNRNWCSFGESQYSVYQ